MSDYEKLGVLFPSISKGLLYPNPDQQGEWEVINIRMACRLFPRVGLLQVAYLGETWDCKKELGRSLCSVKNRLKVL